MTAPLMDTIAPARVASTGVFEPLGTIEDAVVAELSPLLKTSGSYLDFVGDYEREVTGLDGEDDIFDRLCGLAPAVLVRIGSSSFEEQGASDATVSRIEVEVFIVNNHLRSHEARLKGDICVGESDDPGIFRIAADVRALLHGKKFAPGVEALTPLRLVPVKRGDNNMSVWLFTFQAEVFLVPYVDPSQQTAITSIQSDHKLIEEC